MTPILGCIADDVTGATDIALMLARNGMRTVQMLGLPTAAQRCQADAIVVALKTRSIAPQTAIDESVAAAKWLKNQGVKQYFFKYCSTFDSTDKGNIGPVAEALMNFLGSEFSVACPAFPANLRTVYQGHLFVADKLLSESSLRNHPITPMTDANLVRVLDRQTAAGSSVGLAAFDIVNRGAEAIQGRFRELQREGHRFAIADAVSDDNLRQIALACNDMPLLTGGSALSMGLPDNYRKAGLLPDNQGDFELPSLSGPVAILAGSCSTATQQQIKTASAQYPVLALDPLALSKGTLDVERLSQNALGKLAGGPVIIASTATPENVAKAQEIAGKDAISELIEQTFAALAKALVDSDIKKVIVAGGETSGAIAKALGVQQLHIGPEIDPGVPWTAHLDTPELLLAFKSGNFGGEDFFIKASEMVS